MYMLQDVCGGRYGARAIGIDCLKEIVTVKEYLEGKDAAGLLNDSRLDDATMVIGSDAGSDAAKLVALKRDAFAHLQQKYASKMISNEQIARCIHSMARALTLLHTTVHHESALSRRTLMGCAPSLP